MGVLCVSEKNRVEIQDFKEWTAGVYLIEAGCGQGKNYFVFNTLFPYAQQNGKQMLVFSNRVALREQQQAQTQEKDIKLITYQSLEHDEYLGTMQDTKDKVRGLMQQVGEYDYIILDEAHYLYQDAPFNKNTETIIELIARYRTSKIIVLLSATPDLLKKYLQIDKAYFFKADYSYIKEVQYYTKRDTLDEIISKIPENEKIVVFADSKDRLKELHSEYPNSAYPAYYKIQSDCEFYESIVSKGTSFHEEVENRLGRKAVWYERKKKNEELSSYLLRNVGRKYEKDERKELVKIIDYKKDGHFQRKIEKLNHYLTRNQIGFILKSIFENRKTYWIIESAKNERASYKG